MLTHGLSDFRCAQCFQPFPEGTFYEFEGRKYCEHDFRVLFAPSCGKCGKLHVCVLLLLLLCTVLLGNLEVYTLIYFLTGGGVGGSDGRGSGEWLGGGCVISYYSARCAAQRPA